jgi:hypothetical protein
LQERQLDFEGVLGRVCPILDACESRLASETMASRSTAMVPSGVAKEAEAGAATPLTGT